MWGFPLNAIAGTSGQSLCSANAVQVNPDCSDDEASSCASRQEEFDCPICCESFNIVENVPYVLWCGHTLCKNCVLGLQLAVVKFPTLPMQLPLFILCPWCNLLSFRLVYKGDLKFPRKNFFLLWMVESLNRDRDREKHRSSLCSDHQQSYPSSSGLASGSNSAFHQGQNFRRPSQYIDSENLFASSDHVGLVANFLTFQRISSYLRKLLVFFVHLTAKFPLVLVFILIVVYVIPASAIFLVLYILITILFAFPSFLILYFAYPSLDWLFREIFT